MLSKTEAAHACLRRVAMRFLARAGDAIEFVMEALDDEVKRRERENVSRTRPD